jgi:hypothetical protein
LTTPLLDAKQQEAMQLLEYLLYLLLVVVQAAACINASYITVQQYLTQLAKHKEADLESSNNLPRGKLREPSLRDTIAATLSLSISQVRYSKAIAVDYLFLTACVN